MTSRQNELWECPKCGAKLVSKNMWHSCGNYDLNALFAKSEPHVYTLFQTLRELVETRGQVSTLAQKTRICFQARVRFINVQVRKTYLLCEFGFAERGEHPRFARIEQYAPHWFGHRCKVESLNDFDEVFAGWVDKAYLVGLQKHLPQKR